MERRSFFVSNPSVLVTMLILAMFSLAVTVMSEAMGNSALSYTFINTLGKMLCLCLVAVALDVVWGYCGILSLGHFAFFGMGGYAIGMWIMTVRTENLLMDSLSNGALPPTPEEISDAVGAQIFGGVASPDFPLIWFFSSSLTMQLLFVVLVPGAFALIFGWLAFRSRVTGVYLSILTQAMTLAIYLYINQNDSGLRGNNGLAGLDGSPGLKT